MRAGRCDRPVVQESPPRAGARFCARLHVRQRRKRARLAKEGGQWSRGKSFDSFCPLGPCLVTPDEIPNPNALTIRTIVNGTTVQDWSTNDMIFDVPSIIEFLSASTTLLAGTTILTGTPHGVGMAAEPPRWLKPGDKVSVQIEKIGTLTNPVELEP
jgi:2-keto-4-pentenoate hydratase/2-oxohepta-3-ene-1,7-dioic acid hydratase in catechol pathway